MIKTIADKLVEIAENEVKLYERALGTGYTEGYGDGYDKAKSEQKTEVETSVTITENGTSTITPNSRETFSSVKVTVDVPDTNGSYNEGYNQGLIAGKKPEVKGEYEVTVNGEYTYTPEREGDVFSSVKVTVDVETGSSTDEVMDAFWEMYQGSGARQVYIGAFNEWYNCIALGYFKPKYDIVPQGGIDYMFFKFNANAEQPVDLVEELDKLGVKLDFSKNAVTITRVFANANIKRLGVVDFSKTKAEYTGAFLNCANLETIDKLIVNPASSFPTTAFNYCYKLTNLKIGGTIGNTLNLSFCSLLTRESIHSIISALSTTTSGCKLTLPKAAVDREFETSSGANDGATSSEWKVFEEAHTNWTIVLG